MPLLSLLEKAEPLIPLVNGETPEMPDLESGGGAAPPPPTVLLAFTIHTQEQTNWCWAAVATSVALHFDFTWSLRQCELVDHELQQTNCCQDGGCSKCNVERRLSRALIRTGNLRQMESRPMTFKELQAAMLEKAPMCARVEWQGGSGHFVVISGYVALSGVQYVTIEDSLTGQSQYEFQEFLTRYEGSGRCTHAYWTRKA